MLCVRCDGFFCPRGSERLGRPGILPSYKGEDGQSTAEAYVGIVWLLIDVGRFLVSAARNDGVRLAILSLSRPTKVDDDDGSDDDDDDEGLEESERAAEVDCNGGVIVGGDCSGRDDHQRIRQV